MAVTLQNVKVIILPLAKSVFLLLPRKPTLQGYSTSHELKHFLQYMTQNKNIMCTQNIHMQFLKGLSEIIIRQRNRIFYLQKLKLFANSTYVLK